uniref:Uncharacterized protein n=1 Tax=Sciurus vulgaris TaxID=55149 RepID=A0A8D2E048_SCIVU
MCSFSFYCVYPTWYEVECHYDFDFSLSCIVNDVEHLFMCLLAIFISFEEKSIQIFCPLFNQVIFFIAELYESFIYSGNKSLIKYMVCKNHPPPFCKLFIHFLDCVL